MVDFDEMALVLTLLTETPIDAARDNLRLAIRDIAVRSGERFMAGVLSGLTQQVDDCLALEREVLAIVALTGRKQSDVLADIQAQAAQSLLSTLEVAVQMRRDTAHQAFIDDLVRRATTWPDFHAFVVERRRYERQRRALGRYRRWLEAKD